MNYNAAISAIPDLPDIPKWVQYMLWFFLGAMILALAVMFLVMAGIIAYVSMEQGWKGISYILYGPALC